VAVNKTMLFGPIGNQVEIPWPQSGMGSDVNLYTETTELLSGEVAVYRAPVTYKTFNMSWKGGAMKLQPILDVYAGIYGAGPYYITDMLAGVQGYNLLPAKWAACHLLSYVCNGWADPVVTAQSLTPERRQVTFTGSADYADEFPNPIVVPVIPGQPLYSSTWGSRTGAAGVRVYRYRRSTLSWSLDFTLVPTVTNDVPTLLVSQAESNANDIAAVKIVPYCPTGSVLTLAHIDLAINDYRTYTPYIFGLDPALYPALTLYPGMLLFPSGPDVQTMFRSGMGTGPVQFTGNVGGRLDSAVVDRIGFSVDLSEVSRDRNNG
jgi:hypothetical protein